MISKKDANYKHFSYFKDYKQIYFSYIHENFIQNNPIDYLEFGVNKGESIFTMAKLNSNPQSRFYGFDTFTGYPEEVDGAPKDIFNVGGNIPQTDDRRIQFIRGLFQDTLPKFLNDFKPKSKLVIFMDAYIYSSTLYCLAKLDHLIVPGTIITFWSFGRQTRITGIL
jgi:hypothetical protein